MLIRDIMTTDVVSVRPGSTIREAVGLLVRHRFTALPVVDSDGWLTGVVTETDLTALRRHDARSPLLVEEMAGSVPVCVAEVATPDPICVRPWTDVADAVALMRRTGHRSLPVVDGPRLVGIVTRSDVLSADDVADSGIAAAAHRVLERYVGPGRCSVTVSDGVVVVGGVPAGESHTVAVLIQQLPGVRAVEIGAGAGTESR